MRWLPSRIVATRLLHGLVTLTTREPRFGRLRLLRCQGPRSAVGPDHSCPLLTVVDWW